MWITLALFSISIGLLYIFLIWNFNYWTKRGVEGPKPLPYFGNYRKSQINKMNIIHDLDDIYRAYKGTEDFVGIYNIRTPQLLILNPELCQRILRQDFKHFQDNEFSTIVNKKTDDLAANNPFYLTGEAWKKSRDCIKQGLEIETVETFHNAIRAECKKLRHRVRELNSTAQPHGINVKDLCLLYTTGIITDCIYGFNLCGQPSTQFLFNTILNVYQNRRDVSLYFLLTYLVPGLKRFYKAKILPQRVTVLFGKLMQTAIDLRKSQVNHINRRDFLSYMLESHERQSLSTLDIMTHSMNFILHGLLTIYAVLTNCLLLLARYPESQARLRAEIQAHIKKNGAMNFDEMNQLPYLEACICETMRIWMPGFFSSKVCTESIVLPNKSGRSLKLEKGDIVVLPLYSINSDENFYDNPKKFLPERFIGSKGAFIEDYHSSGVYYAFGAGPRKCVGKRFALTIIKTALVEILSHFRINVNSKTTSSDESDPKFISIHPDNEIWLDFDNIS